MLACAPTAARADDVDRDLRAAMARDGVPGLALAVVRHGAVARLAAYGYGDLEWKTRVTPDTRFEIASMSKMFTGAAARILIDEGKLGLEDPVGKYFDHLPDAWKPMRVRHLVTMSSGLPEDWGSDLIPYDADVVTSFDEASLVAAFTKLKLSSPVGAEFHYSSPGYAMLGFIVGKLAGVPFARYIAEHVFAPAGMTETSFIDNWAVVPERAQGYRKADGKLVKGWYLGQFLHARPDVGVLSSARDLARWVIALERRKIVKDPGTLWQGATADSARPLDYAYGWIVDNLLGHARQLHGGRYRTGFRSMIERFPDDDLSVIVLTNCDCGDPGTYAYRVARVYLRDLPDLEREAANADPKPAETAALIEAVRAIGRRTLDARVMTPDALEPMSLADLADGAAHATAFRYAGRRALPRPVTIHGHRLVECETLAVEIGGAPRYLTFFRDERGRVAYVVPL